MISDEFHEAQVEEENYFVSMTDMMVGLVFIFIIMLMYYVLQFRDVTEQLTGADQTRAEILQQLQKRLKDKNIKVEIPDNESGVLRLPDSILFDSGQYKLKPEGMVAVSILANALWDVLPCYSDHLGNNSMPQGRCNPDIKYHIESIYIEGHTDADHFRSRDNITDNLDLSAMRATETYRQIVNSNSNIASLCVMKARCEPILSVSGYGDKRIVDDGPSDEQKKKNRRIDIRIIMVKPDGGKAAADLSNRLQSR